MLRYSELEGEVTRFRWNGGWRAHAGDVGQGSQGIEMTRYRFWAEERLLGYQRPRHHTILTHSSL
ncbi:hypothetical protein Poly21_39270 [Allorhodopirellula heiligendammensis]|uniref:Uncharacterized protein n=1 Tax=Allorhodopirellula heiligendammensis TaxID=2714739 RepID=A0A5C6BZ33_9BACT|nr:hypothetical protein Poly21_39270 [Allorhodopirellula heiligendammensis]